jgi:hypothetical protein
MGELEPNGAGVARQFDDSLRHASRMRERLRQYPRQSLAYNELLSDVLGPYREAVKAYAALAAAHPGGTPPQEASGAYERATTALSDELDRAAKAPVLLRDQTVLLDQGEVLRQEGPGVAPPAQGAAAPPCCMTYILLENVSGEDLHVVATNSEGIRRERDFDKGRKIHRVWKKWVEEGDDDDEGAKAKGGVIEGGLGRCVTLLVQIIGTDGSGKKTYQPDPPYRFEICCNDPKMVKGAVLDRPEPPQDPAHPHSVSPAPLLKIGEIVGLSPCPERTKGTATTGSTTTGWGVGPLIGVKRIDGRYFYGVAARFYAHSTDCRSARFVQGVKRTVEAKYPGKKDFERVDGMSDSKMRADIKKGASTPEYPSRETQDGGREINDGPGVVNPWDGAVNIDEKSKPFPAGTELRITWVYRTWVVCLDSHPVVILGHFDWTVVLHVTVGSDRATTSGHADKVTPTWTDDPDKAGYEAAAGQPPDSSAFLPVK